jgi:hypothetical protein
MHWMSVKLPDNFQMREHSWPCRFHIKVNKLVICEFKRALYGIKCVLWYRTYERGYEISGSPLRFMLRRSSLVECVTRNRCLQSVDFFSSTVCSAMFVKLAWTGQIAGIENQTIMHRFEQYLKILQLYHANSRFPPSFKFWSVSTIQKHWEEVKKCILHSFQDLKALFYEIVDIFAWTPIESLLER